MKLNLHNEINIKIGKNNFKFYNTIFTNIYTKIANLESYFDKIAIGTGICENFSDNYYLKKFLYIAEFENISSQFNPSNNEIFLTKTVKIKTENINSKYITEAGITAKNCDVNNPEIYNYFSIYN